MTNEPPMLGDIIDKAIKKHSTTTYRELARRASDLGIPISYTTLSQMHAGKYRSELSKEMRRRLAKLAGVRLSDLDGVTGMPSHLEFKLPDSADTLTADQREAVLSVVRAFASANRRAPGQNSSVSEEITRLADVRKINKTGGKRQIGPKRFDSQRSVAEEHLLPEDVVEDDDNQDGGGDN